MTERQKSYSTFINAFEEEAKKHQKFQAMSAVLHTIILSAVLLLSRAEAGNLQLSVAILLAMLLLFRIRNFFVLRTHDLKIAQTILDGVKIEKHQSHLEDFFHKHLKKYSFLRVILIMSRRAMADVLILLYFGFVLYSLVNKLHPDFSFNLKPGYSILSLLGYFIGDLYYRPLVPLIHAQREVFA